MPGGGSIIPGGAIPIIPGLTLRGSGRVEMNG